MYMTVFKFGGASLKDATGVKNVGSIIGSQPAQNLLVVVSAMGKTTNMLERILYLFNAGKDYNVGINELRNYHGDIVAGLFEDPAPVIREIELHFTEVQEQLSAVTPFDQMYDQVVSKGELISSIIVHRYLVSQNIPSHWHDSRDSIRTDNNFREGRVDWSGTSSACKAIIPILNDKIVITQGFIGRAESGLTTTLGREGSDFSAAIFASCLDANSVVIWKDVPGVMNADPKRIENVTVFKELPFKEAAEMTYYGASVIHPKTIKPLATKNIPLYVKMFSDPTRPGTKIHECKVANLPPLIVFKEHQCLISCKVTDYTFISEQQLITIFHALSELDIRLNLMQNSAISLSICIDFREDKVTKLIERLQQHFEVFYNTGLTLITIKNYDEKTFEKYRKQKGVLLEQSSRSTLQVLIK
jgi:aspartate kinase